MGKKFFAKSPGAVKRAMDLAICALGAPFALPLGLVIALWIRFDSAGPALYRQERIGKNGEAFRIIKFRTMSRDAEARLDSCLESDPGRAREWRDNHKLKRDPRLTRAGFFLRKTSLDELPQMINVLLGQMSFVGPRPIVAGEVAKYGRRFAEYCSVRPGITGLWQVTGRNNTTYRRRVACDSHYIRRWSAALDLKILLRTIPAAISGNGAY